MGEDTTRGCSPEQCSETGNMLQQLLEKNPSLKEDRVLEILQDNAVKQERML